MDGTLPAAERLGECLRDRDETIAVAESCTGGLVGASITAVPGASDYFVGGVVTYTTRAKRRLLAVSRETLDQHGPVSEPVAREMAARVCDETGAEWGLSTTGYAGPTSEAPETPVGTAYVGVARADGGDAGLSPATVERFQFDGDRREVRERITDQALASLLDALDAVGNLEGSGQWF